MDRNTLGQSAAKKHGKLSIFSSYFPGAGKNCRMLHAAEQAQRSGTDVVIGTLSCSLWPETGTAASRFETLPSKKIQKDGRTVEELEQVRRVRATQRTRREKNEVPVVAIVGYTNAGKSTLLNRLTGADIPANNRLFDTLDTTSRLLTVSDTLDVVISDTVGFIRKLPHHLVEAFKATLEELSYADLLLHVIDASNPLWREQAAVVEQLIVELGAEQTPRIDVFNKCDKFTGDILPHGADIVSISAKTGQGLDELLEKIGGRLDTGACRVVLRLPYDQGGVVDMLHRQAKVERVDYGEAIEVEAVCTPVQLGRLKDYIVSGWTPPKEPWED